MKLLSACTTPCLSTLLLVLLLLLFGNVVYMRAVWGGWGVVRWM